MIVWPGPPPPPTLPNYIFVYINLFVFVCVCLLQLGRNNPLLGCLHATGKTIVNKRFPPPEPCLPFLMLFVLPCMSFVCPVYAFSFCSVLFSSLFFFFRWLFCKEKVTKNTATLFALMPAHPLQHQRFPHHPPFVSPLHFGLSLR